MLTASVRASLRLCPVLLTNAALLSLFLLPTLPPVPSCISLSAIPLHHLPTSRPSPAPAHGAFQPLSLLGAFPPAPPGAAPAGGGRICEDGEAGRRGGCPVGPGNCSGPLSLPLPPSTLGSLSAEALLPSLCESTDSQCPCVLRDCGHPGRWTLVRCSHSIQAEVEAQRG